MVAAGNRVCLESGAAFDRLFADLFAEGNEEPPAATAAPVLSKAVELADAEAAAFGRLKGGAGDSAKLVRVHRAFVVVSAKGRDAAALAAAGDQGYLTAMAATNDAATRAQEIAVNAGFSGCRP
jgi:hypothetical protein